MATTTTATRRLVRHEYGLPVSNEALWQLLNNQRIIRIVTLMDVSSLARLELLEFGLTTDDIRFAFMNGIIEPDLGYINDNLEPLIVSMSNHSTYEYWNNRKFKLSNLGLYIWECLRS